MNRNVPTEIYGVAAWRLWHTRHNTFCTPCVDFVRMTMPMTPSIEPRLCVCNQTRMSESLVADWICVGCFKELKDTRESKAMAGLCSNVGTAQGCIKPDGWRGPKNSFSICYFCEYEVVYVWCARTGKWMSKGEQ